MIGEDKRRIQKDRKIEIQKERGYVKLKRDRNRLGWIGKIRFFLSTLILMIEKIQVDRFSIFLLPTGCVCLYT